MSSLLPLRELKGGRGDGLLFLYVCVLPGRCWAFRPRYWFNKHFGPTLLGLGLTLIVTTLIEVCSDGSSPVAAEVLRQANAPGNAFTFLMAGAATDYTAIMSP